MSWTCFSCSKCDTTGRPAPGACPDCGDEVDEWEGECQDCPWHGACPETIRESWQ
ncbi:MAG: hypothetical protein ACYC0Q_14540 [Eubacteriales bacterium]